MIDIDRSNFLKYFLFGSLYFSEGLMIAITTFIIPFYLLEKGVSTPLTTLIVGIVNIPWILKFVWGPIVDYFIRFGRKKFVTFGGVLTIFSMFGASFIDPSISLIPFTILIFLGHVGIGFIDVSADAWAIDVSTEKDHGKINGSMFSGQYTGWAIGSVFLGFVALNFGYNLAFFTNGLLILVILIFPLFVKEITKIKTKRKVASLLLIEFKKKTTQLTALFSPVVYLNTGMIMFMIPLYLKISFDFDPAQGGLFNAILPISMVIGSVAGGISTDKWGRKLTLYLLLGFSAIFTASLIFTDNWLNFAIIYGIIGFLMGGYETVVCALFMDVTNPRIGATQYGIFTGLANLGINGIGMVTGSMVSSLGFARTFLYAGWVCGPAILLLYFIKLKKHERVT
jgi:MFS transporter, PAT family, beta-lactamase induction signal transducer AmpG